MKEKKKILIADDEPSVVLLVKRLLAENYIVIGANNGEDAVDAARTQRPDLILMDIMMPKMDGYAACHAIKTDQATKTIPVVMLTAINYELNKKLSEQMGANGYIAKPFSLQNLLDIINRFLVSPK